MSKRAIIIAGTLALCGCPAPETEVAPDAGPTCASELQVDWGRRDNAGEWVDFEDDERAEITLGFQGFRYIESAVRLRGSEAELVIVAFRIEVEGHPAFSRRANMKFDGGPGGNRYADVLVFINDIPLPQLIGRRTTVSVHALADDCGALNTTDVIVVDDVRCIQLENGELQCSES